MAKQRSTDRSADTEISAEALAFRAAMRDVRPLVQTSPAAGLLEPAARRRPRKRPATVTENLDETMPLVVAQASGEERAATDTLSFQRAQVRPQVLRRLRRGLYPVENELDLHGLTQTHAREQLALFIAGNRDAGRRCVRIIHGKGYRSGARGPVLKIAVNLWLRRHPDVLAFTSARTIDGGSGALYVLLRA